MAKLVKWFLINYCGFVCGTLFGATMAHVKRWPLCTQHLLQYLLRSR